MENKGSNVRYNKINITFPDMVIVENIIPRNMIINLGCASVDNHIPRDDIFDYHHIREGNIYIIFGNIGIAPITLVTYVRNKNSNIQGRSLNVIKVICHTIRNCS